MKIFVIALMMILMSGIVIGEEAISTIGGCIECQTMNQPTFFSLFLQSIIGFHAIEYNGESYDCPTGIDAELTVGGQKHFKLPSGQICYTNPNSFPVTMQIFKSPSWGQVGNDVDIFPGKTGCLSGLTTIDTYAGVLYYCYKKTDYSSNCIDSDGGIDYYKFGETFESSKGYEDSCTGDYLKEYYCSTDEKALATSTKCPYGCSDGRCLKQGEQESETCGNGICGSGETATNCQTDCYAPEKITCYKCENDVLKTENVFSCSSGFSEEKPSCGEQPPITGESGFTGKPTFSPARIKQGDSITVTQEFYASQDGKYFLEAGTEFISSWVPELASTIGIETNECNPAEKWYNNKEVQLSKGKHTITFTLIPSDKGIQKDGEYIIHTALVIGCGNDTIGDINIASTSLYIGEPSEGEKIKCGKSCSPIGNNEKCETGWCYHFDEGFLSKSINTCQPKEGTIYDPSKNPKSEFVSKGGYNFIKPTSLGIEFIKGGGCLSKNITTKTARGMYSKELKSASGEDLIKSTCLLQGSTISNCETGSRCKTAKSLILDKVITESDFEDIKNAIGLKATALLSFTDWLGLTDFNMQQRNIGFCVIIEEEQETKIDFCSWTSSLTFLPEDNRCTFTYGGIVLIFLIIIFLPKGGSKS